jgi:ABC-type uncharacterized transport system ATPase subunit
VAAAAEVHARLRSLATEGAAVLFHSTDLDEVMMLADRVVVVSGGVVRHPAALDRDLVGRMMVGAE